MDALTLLSLLLFRGDCLRLGDEEYLVRRDAQARLRANAYLSWRACGVFAHSPDAEVRRRARRAAAYGAVDQAPMWFFAFWEDPVGATFTNGGTRLEVWIHSERVPGLLSPLGGWHDAARARAWTRALAEAALRAGVPRGAVDRVLARMRERESKSPGGR